MSQDEPTRRARVEFPADFLQQLDEFIPDLDWRDFVLNRAVRPDVARNWAWYLIPELPADGAIGTDDGYRDIPPLWLWFSVVRLDGGEPLVVFNRAARREPLGEAEDQSDG